MTSARSCPYTVMAGYILGAGLFSKLPKEIPPSWNASGHDTIWLGRPVVAFLLPTAAAITFVLLRRLCMCHPLRGDDSPNLLITYDGHARV